MKFLDEFWTIIFLQYKLKHGLLEVCPSGQTIAILRIVVVLDPPVSTSTRDPSVLDPSSWIRRLLSWTTDVVSLCQLFLVPTITAPQLQRYEVPTRNKTAPYSDRKRNIRWDELEPSARDGGAYGSLGYMKTHCTGLYVNRRQDSRRVGGGSLSA